MIKINNFRGDLTDISAMKSSTGPCLNFQQPCGQQEWGSNTRVFFGLEEPKTASTDMSRLTGHCYAGTHDTPNDFQATEP